MKRLSVVTIILVLLLGGISCGKSEPGTTLPDTTPPLITNVSASNISETTVIIIWTTDEPATSQAEYGKTTDYGLTTALDEYLGTSHSITLDDLEPNTIYHFRVKSKDEARNEAISEDKTFITLALPDTTPPVITEVNGSNVVESSATITWTTDEPATSQVEYGKTTDYGLTTALDESLVTSHCVSLNGLEPSTTYHFRANSKDETGNEALSDNYTFVTSKPATEVGGIISSNAIWTEGNSPYVVTGTVQIPVGVTLTIEPGVTVTMPSGGDMFLLHGTIFARGTANKKIIFDGGANSDIITTEGGAGVANLDYCIIRNGRCFWDGGGYFNLTHSELANLTRGSEHYLWESCIGLESPSADCHIEYNKFVNTGGLWAYQAAGRICKIYIRYNLFQEMSSPIVHAGGSPGQCEMIVKYNSFIDIDGMILLLEPDFQSTNMNGTENYWGTLDTNIIDQKIYDKNDDIRVKNYISYLPILTQPHPSTPRPD